MVNQLDEQAQKNLPSSRPARRARSAETPSGSRRGARPLLWASVGAASCLAAAACNEWTIDLTLDLSPSGHGSPSEPSPEDEAYPGGHGHGDRDVCVDGYEPHPADGTLAPGYATYEENGQLDATLQPEMIEWMEERYWQESHYQWHQVRRCVDSPFELEPGVVEICNYPELRPEANECENGQDGYEFLAMHRHMLESLRQLWPSRAADFEGWESFPSREDYPDIVQEYYRDWGDDVVEAAAIADDIENHLDMFPDEGAFAMWIQCGTLGGGFSPSSLHGALHFNGAPFQNQSHNVSNGRRNLDSYVFWKLHGWIDNIWERYRVATGKAPNESALQQEMLAQCREMHALADVIEQAVSEAPPEEGPPEQPGGEPGEEPGEPLVETGYFHEVVRPALEDFGCSLCHGAGETAGLRLGFEVTSSEIVERLVNRPAANAIGYTLVVPGDPDNSWLYLKATGESESSGVQCQGSMNCAQSMPPGGGRLPDEALEALRQWIADGAPAPVWQ